MTEPHFPGDIPWSVLGRYLAGELPPDERAAIERWIEASPERVQMVDELRRLWDVAPTFRQEWNVEAAVRRVVRRSAEPARVIRLPALYREAPDSASTWRRVRRLALRAAAAIAVVGGGVWAVRRPVADGVVELSTAPEVRTQPGQRASLRLPDGSEVWLGPASTIRYVVGPRHGPRTLSLDGEAYFAVVHDAARPFTVHTAYGVATDLGTRFGVRAYRSDSVVEVAVEEGKVALAAKGPGSPGVGHRSARGDTARQVVLAARDVGTVTASGIVRAERGADVAARLAWKDGRLELQNVTLRDAAVRLGRWYGIDVHLDDSASAGRRLAASFKRESAVEAIQLIAATLALRVEWRGTTATLSSKRPS